MPGNRISNECVNVRGCVEPRDGGAVGVCQMPFKIYGGSQNERNKKGVLVHDRDLFFFFFRVAIATAQRLQG